MPDTYTFFSAAEYQARLERTQRLLESKGWDALLCYASAIIPGSVLYLSGYETRLRIHDACYLLFAPGADPETILFTNARWENAAESTWVPNVVITSGFGPEIAARIPQGSRRLAVAGYRYLPLSTYLNLRSARPDVEIIDGTQDFLETRMVKSAAEVAALLNCARICDAGADKFLELARLGARERDIAAAVDYAMKIHGSDEVSFTTQVGCGARTANVVVYPGDEELCDHDAVQLDCGATWHGYRGDLSRVAVVGRPDQAYAHMLQTVEEMYFRCLEVIRPGATAGEIARAGIATAKERGLGALIYTSPNHASGFVGHGIGCHYSEPPELHPADETIICKDMVLVVEPILTKPGLGGVKIEDLVLVTATGTQRLSSCPIRTWND